MSIYKNLKAIRKLTNSSLTSIIDITNLNFSSLSSGTLEFLNNISYDETANSFSVNKGTFDLIDITDTISLKLDGVPTFTIDSLGRAEGQELLVKVAETQRLRLTDFNDWPTIGVPGEIIYTGVQNQKPEFGEDFIGYLQGKGWVSLTDKGNSYYITLLELSESPPIPGCPAPNSGRVWVGPPGYATETVPTTQTLYYTDENCKVFDLTAGGTGSGTGAGACSFVMLKNFTANTPEVIPHNLASTNVQVQLIDTVTNEQISAYINNYQSNSVNITLSQTKNLVKVIVISADCGGDQFKSVTVNFTSSSGSPTTITHNLGTKNFTFALRDGNAYVGDSNYSLTYLDDDSIEITPSLNITDGYITFNSKI